MSDVLKVATGNTKFKVTGRSTIMEKIKNLHARKSAEIQTSPAAANHVVLALDYLSSLANDSYLGVHAFFVTADWQLRNVTLDIDSNKQQHTSENIKEQVIGFMAKWQLLEEGSDHCASDCKAQYICSDNAANMVKAVRLLQANHMPHTLQLAINCGPKESGVTNTLAKRRKIVGHYKHSTQQKEQLLSIQKELDLS